MDPDRICHYLVLVTTDDGQIHYANNSELSKETARELVRSFEQTILA